MPETTPSDRPAANADANRARDHLANERTFLAWLRTGIALVVFGFAIGRFAIAIRQFIQLEQRQGQGHFVQTAGLSGWIGAIAILGGVAVIFTGLFRYRQTRHQIEIANFEPAGAVIDLVGILVALFGLALAGYLVYIQLRL